MSKQKTALPCIDCYHFIAYQAMCGREKVPSRVYGEVMSERYAHTERRAPSLIERILRKPARCGPDGKYFRQSSVR